MLEVIAGIVLAQSAQAVPNSTIRQHDLEPERQVTHVAVAQHGRATGVRSQVPADRATALRTEGQRKQSVDRRCRLLQVLQQDASLDGNGFVRRIDLADACHAGQRQYDLGATVVRNRSAAQAGIATLRNQRDAVRVADLRHRGHLLGGRRPHDQRCGAPVRVTPVTEVTGHPLGVADDPLRADDRFKGVQEGLGVHGTSDWNRLEGVPGMELRRWTNALDDGSVAPPIR